MNTEHRDFPRIASTLTAAGLTLLAAVVANPGQAAPAATGSTASAASTAAAPAIRSGNTRVEDSMAQRLQACTPCHGHEGVATASGYFPRIAGKPEGYLFEQLMNFKEGRRGHTVMRQLVTPLSAAYLQEIAGHFAALNLPYPPPEPPSATAEVLQRGKQLIFEGDASLRLPACIQCHGQAMTGVLPATPGLLGLSKDYLVAQLGAWRNGLRAAREPDCMKTISLRMKESDIHAVSAYLSSQALPHDARAVKVAAAKADMPGTTSHTMKGSGVNRDGTTASAGPAAPKAGDLLCATPRVP